MLKTYRLYLKSFLRMILIMIYSFGVFSLCNVFNVESIVAYQTICTKLCKLQPAFPAILPRSDKHLRVTVQRTIWQLWSTDRLFNRVSLDNKNWPKGNLLHWPNVKALRVCTLSTTCICSCTSFITLLFKWKFWGVYGQDLHLSLIWVTINESEKCLQKRKSI